MCRKIQHARIDNVKALSNLICGKSAVGGNYNSTCDTSKSGENFNHKIEWGNFRKEITKGKAYNCFPRGRVEINKGRIVIFLNPYINNEVVINKVVEEFELQNIENIRIVADGSRHYEYHA